jgi:hypothetical protein
MPAEGVSPPLYLLLLLPVVFFSPPCAERLLLAPPAALPRLDDLDEEPARGLVREEEPEDLL